MTYFLEYIADSLHKEFGNTLNRHCLVFPSRRAGLYFIKYLAARIEKPVWSPSTITINELFRSYSSLQIAGNEILLFELYKVYRNLKKPAETFDEFYYWGDMLLNDFDDVDKYLVDARMLFGNVLDIKNIDNQFGGLTEYQIEIIKRFWTNFNHEKPTAQKTGFINIWSVLADLYSDFRDSLAGKNLAYEGMVFREFADNKDVVYDERWDLYHFIGFNALNECEKVMMSRLKKAGKARFYWDFDNSYIREGNWNSAGLFMQGNLKAFGNDMPTGWSYDTMLSVKSPGIVRRVIDSSSDVAQVKLISKLIDEMPGISKANAHHTAVVLADENLLVPVLTSLPEKMEEINITMGYPLRQTLVYTLLRQLMDLQKNASAPGGKVTFFYKDVIAILRHSLFSELMNDMGAEVHKEIIENNLKRIPGERFADDQALSLIFKNPLNPAEFSRYFKDVLSLIATGNKSGAVTEKNRVQLNIRNEFIYRIVLSINKLETIINDKDIIFSTDTYIKILDRMLRLQSVPFSGEPLEGIQIMGILETRALDFKNLVILSVNEGTLPAVSSGSSFIPFSLREAFGIPSVNYQESIYAYHFYRLLQRAENVTLVYNSNSEGLRSGEMSRFIMQMKYDEVLKPDFRDSDFTIKTNLAYEESLERSDEHTRQLVAQYLNSENPGYLSPSAINTWINCRMRFFYKYICKLKEPSAVVEGIDPAMLGNMIHDIMETLYRPYKNNEVSGEMLNMIIKNKEYLSSLINDALLKNYRSARQDSGNELIVRDVLSAYLHKILKADAEIAPFVIIDLEKSLGFELSFIFNGQPAQITTGGKIDRIDNIRGMTRIVDYKTGNIAESLSSIDDLFLNDRKKDYDGWLQTLLYCEAYLSTSKESRVMPSVYRIKKNISVESAGMLKIKSRSNGEILIDNYNIVRDEFLSGLKDLIGTIFNESVPFVKTRDVSGKCAWCPYRVLCSR